MSVAVFGLMFYQCVTVCGLLFYQCLSLSLGRCFFSVCHCLWDDVLSVSVAVFGLMFYQCLSLSLLQEKRMRCEKLAEVVGEKSATVDSLNSFVKSFQDPIPPDSST